MREGEIVRRTNCKRENARVCVCERERERRRVGWREGGKGGVKRGRETESTGSACVCLIGPAMCVCAGGVKGKANGSPSLYLRPGGSLQCQRAC